MVKSVNYGKRKRMSYARIDEVLEAPNLLEVQISSFNWFIKEGLKEVLNDISPIVDYSDNLVMEFVDHHFEDEYKYSVNEAKDHDTNYAAPLKVRVRLYNKSTGEIKEQEE